MVHGGAYGNVIFLPQHAVVVDIYPYGFLPALHGYVQPLLRRVKPTKFSYAAQYSYLLTTMTFDDWALTSVMNGIQLAAPSMKYGYRRVETNDSSTVVMTDGYCLPPNCAAM
eukprot:EG_transcript_60343